MKKIYHCILLLISAVLMFSSCITNKQKLYLQSDELPYPVVPFQEYELSVNDEIIYYLMTTSQETQSLYNGDIRGGSLQNPHSYRIYEDGCVVLPTIGQVYIAGKTIKEAEKLITERFKSIVLDAEIKLALANNNYYVQGDGGKGQYYVYKDNLTVFQALAQAGDISSVGDKKNIKIIRRGNDGMDYVKTFDLRKESIISSEFYYIRPNDVIYIPTNSNSFFRIESISSFISLVVAPLSLVAMSLSFF